MPRTPGRCCGAVLSVAADESGFPLGSGVAHTASVPFARALGARWLGLQAAADGQPLAQLLLPCRPALCDAHGAVDRRAIVALLDHAGAPACYGAQVAAGATATLELRIDFVGHARPGADVVVESHCVAADGHSALISGRALHPEGGDALLRMTGRYVVGLGPGRANDSSETATVRAANVQRHAGSQAPAAPDFAALLGGHCAGGGFDLAFQPWLVGSVALPALHGGVVAAGLMVAAEAARPPMPADREGGLRLTSLSVQFLRAAQAVDTRFSGRVEKAGTRAVYLAAEATQHAGARRIACAQALYA